MERISCVGGIGAAGDDGGNGAVNGLRAPFWPRGARGVTLEVRSFPRAPPSQLTQRAQV